jgi:hypothetical protein
MGAGNSSLQENRIVDDISFSNEKNDDISNMRNHLEFINRLHQGRLNTFKSVKSSNMSSQFDIKLPLLQQVLDKYEDENEKQNIIYLYNIGAFYQDKSNVTYKSLKYNDKFEGVYTKFLLNLSNLKAIKSITLGINHNVVDNEQLTKMHENTSQILNNFLSRIIFYSYAIIYNNYLMFIYTIYAQKQFTVMDSNFRKLKKQSEFRDIGLELKKKLVDIQDELRKNSVETSTQLEVKINALNTSLDTLKQNASSHFQSGGNLGNVQVLIKLHDEKKIMYDKSNNIVKTYFDLINKIIQKNAQLVLQHYKDTKLTKVFNKNLQSALIDIKAKIENYKFDNFDNLGEIDDTTFTQITQEYNIQETDKEQIKQFRGVINDLIKKTAIENNKEILNQLLEQENIVEEPSNVSKVSVMQKPTNTGGIVSPLTKPLLTTLPPPNTNSSLSPNTNSSLSTNTKANT